MEQPVYTGGYGIRLISQNPDEQQQNSQANFIMASHQDQNNQILIADESTGQHIVHAPQMQQQQYIQQEDGSQYLIQSQSPHQTHQVFYTNIQQAPQNVNRIIQNQQQGNIMQHQNPQKVKISNFR